MILSVANCSVKMSVYGETDIDRTRANETESDERGGEGYIIKAGSRSAVEGE